MEDVKSQTFKIKKETFEVSQKAKDNLKEFNRIKKRILEAMGEDEVTVLDIASKINMSANETLYYLMSLLKFGMIKVVGIDDMDEYYFYKIKK